MHRIIITKRIVRWVVAVLVLIILGSGIASITATRKVAADDFTNRRSRPALPAMAADDFTNGRGQLLSIYF